jgi:hypothetical protein
MSPYSPAFDDDLEFDADHMELRRVTTFLWQWFTQSILNISFVL